LSEVFVVPKVKVNDIQMCYEVRGEGFPLVMIMGLSGNMDWWDPRMIQGLSKNFKTVVFDNRGAGRTDVSDREYSIKLFADDTVGLMDALGISRAHVLGISMGGMIAQELVLNYPEKVEKLVLCSTMCGGAESVQASPEVLGALTGDVSGLSGEEMAKMMVPLCFTKDFVDSNPDFMELVARQVLKAPISNEAFVRQLGAVMQFQTYDRLCNVEKPTLVLCGRKDILIPPENGPILAKAIPKAKLVQLGKSAHGLAEDMEEATKAITEFLL
jgi:pimeloyl-ACP methyl ester carboxylesterase